MEQRMGRRMYRIMKGLEGRVAANMVAVNPASWLTNFVPLTQGWGTLDNGMLLKGMWDTLKAYHTDDGVAGLVPALLDVSHCVPFPPDNYLQSSLEPVRA